MSAGVHFGFSFATTNANFGGANVGFLKVGGGPNVGSLIVQIGRLTSRDLVGSETIESGVVLEAFWEGILAIE